MEDEETKKPAPTFAIGQDLSSMSVEELEETIELLKAEIVRLEDSKAAKASHLSDAEALFSRK